MRDLGQMAELLLAVVVKGYNEAGVPLPDVQYVAPGAIAAYDGEQLTVNVARILPGRPGATDPYEYATFAQFMVQLNAVVVRNCPSFDESGNAPSPTDLQDAAETNLLDVTTMTGVLLAAQQNALLVDRGIPWTYDVSTYGPEGDVMAVVGSVTVPWM